MNGFFVRAVCVASAVAAFPTTLMASPATESKIASIVAASPSCAAGPWKPKDHSHAPAAFLTGVGAIYLQSYCETKKGVEAASAEMSRPVGHKPDVFAYFQSELQQHSATLATPEDRLRALYTLAIGVGMNESDGNPTEGPLLKTPEEAEAGLFQMSYNSLTRKPPSSPWLSTLYSFYRAHPETCMTDVFMRGIKDKHLDVKGAGTPAGDFQAFTKACPAFATQYGLVMLRVQADYYGTVIETNPHGELNKAQFVPACSKMLSEIEALGCD
jgi:hypothetical protein